MAKKRLSFVLDDDGVPGQRRAEQHLSYSTELLVIGMIFIDDRLEGDTGVSVFFKTCSGRRMDV